MIFRPFYSFDTGCAAYLFGCGGLGKCAVVDAHVEDVEEYLTFAEAKGMRITHVIDTHVHADHRSGGGPIATKTLLISWKGGSLRGEERAREGPPEAPEEPGLVAYDKITGEEVGFAKLPAAPIGTPMTYVVDGKQYIALTVTGSPPKVVAMSLPPTGFVPNEQPVSTPLKK